MYQNKPAYRRIRSKKLQEYGLHIQYNVDEKARCIDSRSYRRLSFSYEHLFGGLGGAILGSLLAPLLQRFLQVGQIIITVRWLFALLWPFYMLVNHPLLLGIVEFLCCFIDPFEDVAHFSYRLTVIPNELRARVISVCRMFTSISNPFGQLLMGFILERYGVPKAVIFGWIILIITALLFNLQPQVRAARQPV